MNPFPGSPEKTRDSLLPKLALKPWVIPDPIPLLLINVQVVDVRHGDVWSGQDVYIEKGLIKNIAPGLFQDSTSWNELGEKCPVVIDLMGMFLCPGLIDCHVHVTAVPGARSMSDLAQTAEELIHLRSTYVLREMLLRGFTTVRDTGGASKNLADVIDEGLILGPRLFQCGKALSQTGGHGDLGVAAGHAAGCCGGSTRFLSRTCDGVPEALKATREELRGGADFIKIMCGGGVASPTDAIETVQFTAEELQAITTTCKQMGDKHTTAHAYTDASVLHAINNGVRGIEHGNLISKDTAKLMAAKNIFLTPTLSCYGIMVRPPWEDFLPPDGKIKNQQVMEKGLDALKMADEAGVIICYGSDLLTSMHALQTEEFSVRASVLPSQRVLQHATCNAASMLRNDKIGRIESGCHADLLILSANPLKDVTILDRPEDHLYAVIKGGRVISSKVDGLDVDAMF